MKKFALIGAAGYVAPRHMKAIKETGNVLVAALDKHDSVGILDSYFPDTHFFTEFERFDRHIDKLKRTGTPIDYLSICSPNYLHDAHIRFSLRCGMEVICEKPLVLNPWNIDSLQEIEQETGNRVNCILQLRHHPAIINLKKQVEQYPKDQPYQVDLTYITSRGNWYHHSWKGDLSKSGGIATNIGIHFFDMLLWIFGAVQTVEVIERKDKSIKGILTLERATVSWFLSIDAEDVGKFTDGRTFRSITIDGESLEFTHGFTDLHTISYHEILANQGFGIAEVMPTIQLVHTIRNSKN